MFFLTLFVFFFSHLVHLISFYLELTGKLILGERLDGNQSSRSEELREVELTTPVPGGFCWRK